MLGRDNKNVEDMYEWKRQQLCDLKVRVPSDEFIYNKYDVIRDKSGHIKIRINIFKGRCSDENMFMDGKLRMIRIKLDFSELVRMKALSFTDLAVRDNIEQFDIQFELFEDFLATRYKKHFVRQALAPIYEKYDGSIIGTLLGYIFLTYDDFIALNNYLQHYIKASYV